MPFVPSHFCDPILVPPEPRFMVAVVLTLASSTPFKNNFITPDTREIFTAYVVPTTSWVAPTSKIVEYVRSDILFAVAGLELTDALYIAIE